VSNCRSVSPAKLKALAKTSGAALERFDRARIAALSFYSRRVAVIVFEMLTCCPSTNPHFGVFLPPVALVGDPMQSPVLVRLQVNQVRSAC
jgi:hypothetical protein